MGKSLMLMIKRVPTLVTNYQKEDSEGVHTGCGRNCLQNCCISGAKLPLYTFKRASNFDSQEQYDYNDETYHPPMAFLESLLLGEWEKRMQRGLFRYDVTACESKVIPGKLGFIAQLNEGRHLKKRPTEFRVDRVLQPFDRSKFNFTKVGQEEILFQVEAMNDGVQFLPNVPVRSVKSPNVVAINVSPIEYGHVLLIPRILDCLPQRIDSESLLLALHMAVEADNPFFRLGYNSLGAFATINHLHFQAYYLALPLPIEKANHAEITTLSSSGVKMCELLDYPVKGLVFHGGNAIQDLSNVVCQACISLQDNNIPFNVLISDCGLRVFLLPQCYAEKQALGEVSKELLETQVNPAVWEISGHMVLKRKKDFDEASEGNARRLLAEVSLSEERFREVVELFSEVINGSCGENFC